jgi:hypothetical protein
MKLTRYAAADLPTVHGPFRVGVYREDGVINTSELLAAEHMAIVRGLDAGENNVRRPEHSD